MSGDEAAPPALRRHELQARHDRLVREIEALRERLQQWQQGEARYHARMAQELQPELRRWIDRQRELARRIEDALFFAPPPGRPIGRAARLKAQAWMLALAGAVLAETPDDAEMQALRARHQADDADPADTAAADAEPPAAPDRADTGAGDDPWDWEQQAERRRAQARAERDAARTDRREQAARTRRERHGVDAHYHKIHLYDAFGFTESRTVAPGFDPVTIAVDGVTVGLTTCYDVRFPELYVELARRGAQLITVHASWGSGPGKLEQWTLLARARALDTTGFIAAVDQAYPGDEIAKIGPTGVGGSLVTSPTGEVLAAAGAERELLVFDVDLDAANQVRDTIAVLQNRSQFAQFGKAQSLG